MHETLQRLFQYKAWANDELLKQLATLDEDTQTVGLSIKALSHSYIVDRIFAAHLRGTSHDYASANASELPKLAALAADIRRSDQEYIDYVATLRPEQLTEQIDFSFTDGAPGRMSREEMLMHVITHSTGHRGQVSALMIFNALPPSKDGFTTYLHESEAASRGRAAA